MMMLRSQSVSRKHTGAILLLLVSLIVSTIPCCDAKKDRNVAHGHRGKLRPYSPGPFAVKLTAADEATLRSGQPVTKQTVPDDPNAPGTVLCIQDVEAPVSAVWKQILDMDQYNKKVSKVTECKNYFVSKLSNGRVTIKTKQVLGVLPGYSFESYYDHTFYPAQSSLTWTLDYDKTSDLEDVAGHWHVESAASHSADNTRPCSRVFYACDVQMKGVVPAPLMNYMSKTALRQATAWVKKESEAHPELTVSSSFGGNMLPASPAVATSKPSASSVATAGGATDTGRRRLWGLI